MSEDLDKSGNWGLQVKVHCISTPKPHSTIAHAWVNYHFRRPLAITIKERHKENYKVENKSWYIKNESLVGNS